MGKIVNRDVEILYSFEGVATINNKSNFIEQFNYEFIKQKVDLY